MDTQIKKDAQLITELGGPAQVAKLLGYPDEIGTQRVFNWTKRGIPAKVRIERPDLFMQPENEAASA